MVLREAVLQCATSHNVNLGATISWVARIIELSEIRPITICHHLSCSVGLGVEYESLDPGQKYVCECKKKDLSEAGQRADDRSGTFSRNGRTWQEGGEHFRISVADFARSLSRSTTLPRTSTTCFIYAVQKTANSFRYATMFIS